MARRPLGPLLATAFRMTGLWPPSPSDAQRLPTPPVALDLLPPTPIDHNGVRYCGECREFPLHKGENGYAELCPVCTDRKERGR